MNQAGGIVANAGTLKVGVGIGGGTYNLTGGQVTVGAGGIVGASSYTINLGGGTVAAAANWSSAAAMTLTGINGNATFDTTGGSISLSGPLSGAGGLQKVGPGVLSLTASRDLCRPDDRGWRDVEAGAGQSAWGNSGLLQLQQSG